jgi:hypothetical protein
MSRVRYSGAAHDDEADDHEWRDVLTKGDSCLVMVDCETSGTASILPIFLIGSLWWDDDSVYARQWLARDYSEECAMLASFAKCMNETDVMFTYNGRTFDVPYMKSRCCFHGISFPAIRHVDLLPIARKRWRDRLPNFQLRTIETNLCGRDRIEDLPSAHVPMCYHAHVQDPASHSIAPVLRHNLTDVMTLLETICLLFESRM